MLLASYQPTSLLDSVVSLVNRPLVTAHIRASAPTVLPGKHITSLGRGASACAGILALSFL